MNQHEKEFLEQVLIQPIFLRSGAIYKVFCQLRFDPYFHQDTGKKRKKNRELLLLIKNMSELAMAISTGQLKKSSKLDKMYCNLPQYEQDRVTDMEQDLINIKKDVQDSDSPTYMKDIVRKISEEFHDEMQRDGVDTEFLLGSKAGQKGKWKKVYQWLWDFKYSRWIWEDKLLNQAKQKKNNSDWLEVHEVTQVPVRPSLPPEPSIPLDRCVNLLIKAHNITYQNCYLILLNFNLDSEKTTILSLCPSAGYSQYTSFHSNQIQIPQTTNSLKYSEVKQEEFIAIITEKQCSTWFNKLETDNQWYPILQEINIKDLWEEIQECSYQLFYKSYQVKEQ